MSRVEASATVSGPVEDVERLWFDTRRWPVFVEGFAHVVRADAEWPASGALVWQSRPHGRGRVFERVVGTDPHTSEVEDERLRGEQAVVFEPHPDGVRVTVRLTYELKEGNLLTPIVDLLFIRRSIRDALTRSLSRFATERRADALTGI